MTTSTTERDWLRTFVPRPSATRRLLCFPHAGGAASAFRDLAARAPADIEVTAVQYPARQDRSGEPMPEEIADLAERIVAVVGPSVRRTTAFFGHSMGSVVAFEVARRLRPRFPSPLSRLYVSACKAPSGFVPHEKPMADGDIRRYVGELGGTGPVVLDNDDLWRMSLGALRADLHAIHRYTYRPGPPLGCPIVAIAGSEDASATVQDMRRWKDFTVSGFSSRELPGGHFYLDHSLEGLLGVLGVSV
jgi:pyochelin biosynthetic protein PchC